MALIHHWTFEEGAGSSVTDAVGGVTLTLSAPDTFTTGHDGDYALSGDAEVSGAVSLATPAAPITLMGWVRPGTLSGSHTPLFGWWGDSTLFSTGTALFAQRSDYGPSGVFQGNVRVNGSLVAVGGEALTVGTWSHLALTYDGTTIRVFHNGVEVGSQAASGTMTSYDYFTVRASSGDVDEVRVYDTALSAAEIDAIANPATPTPPTAGFTASMSDLTVTLTDTSTGATSWAWDFGDGATSSEQSPTHTYAAAGDYTVTLTATNADGSDTASQVVTATDPPVPPTAGFTASVVDLTVTLTDTSTGATSWAWDFGDGTTSSVQSPVHTYAAEGTYPVTLTATNADGSDTYAEYVTVTDPTPDPNPNPEDNVAPTWTTPSDVTTRWIGGDVPATDAQLNVLLADAEDTILGEFPDLQADIDADTIPLSRVRKVAARVVIRHLRNPSGLRSTQDGAGPFQRTTTYGGDEPGALYLTDEDRRELGGARSGRAFQVDGTPPPVDQTSPTAGFQGWTTASDFEGA